MSVPKIEVSAKILDTLADWFPDCKGTVDTSDAICALYGYEITEGEMFDFLTKLDEKGVEKFWPFCQRTIVRPPHMDMNFDPSERLK
jgi:hypothetical protein